MSTRSYESGRLTEHANLPDQTRSRVGRAFDYLFSKGDPLRERAATIAKTASQHPVYAWAAIGLVAFGLGFFLRGSRPNK
ncbi:MAG TPA: hypothetical protein VFR18_27810 [Terriglobia bacterium]|nr:hypothetical protein [Terriglobia bacterium]